MATGRGTYVTTVELTSSVLAAADLLLSFSCHD